MNLLLLWLSSPFLLYWVHLLVCQKLSRLHSDRRNQGDSRLEEEEQRKIGEGLVGISEFSFSVIAEFVTTAYIIAATDFTRWAKPNYQLSGQAQYRSIELA